MEPSTPSITSARRTAVLLIGVAFIAGALIGFAAGRFFSITHPPGSGRGGEFARDRVISHLSDQLKLTPQQRDQVAQIIDRHHRRMEEMSAGIRPQMRQEIEVANREIEAVLTPEQRQKFEQMHRIFMQHRRRHDGAPVPPGF